MAKEKFLLISLKEQESKQLAQILANDTARKILDFLSDREATESELSKKLGVPLSTVHYNLQALLKGKMVEADEFHYSEKGKEVLHYKLANKYIIIAPKSTWGIKEKLKGILPVLGLAAAGSWLIDFFGKRGLSAASSFSEPLAVEEGARIMKVGADAAMPVLADAQGNMFMQFGAEAAPQAAQEAISVGFQISPALWFLLGSVLAVVVLTLVDYARYRRKQ